MAKFCSECGAPLSEGAVFCSRCGAGLSAPASDPSPHPSDTGQTTLQGEAISPNIILCTDGKYRWVYELSLLKNPTIVLLVWKIFFFIVLGIFVVATIADSGSSGFWWDGFLSNLKIFGYILAGTTVLVALGYLLYAAIMGGKYCVMFEMDEQGINHKQMPAQAKKAQMIAMLTALAGAASHSPTTAGVGLNAARTEMYSEFACVRKVKSYPRRRLIKLNERLFHNQVYAAPEDFAFVEGYIRSHCPRLK